LLRAVAAAAVVVMLAGFVGAIVDYWITNDRVPPEPRCDVSTAECGDEQNAWWSCWPSPRSAASPHAVRSAVA
jgi:hypothetical protein